MEDPIDWRQFLVISSDPTVETHIKIPYNYFGILVKQSFDKGQKVLKDEINKSMGKVLKDEDGKLGKYWEDTSKKE